MTALGVLLFLFFLFVAIALHEFGHFATAKWFGMKVERYFIGFGRPIWSTKRGDTEYGIAALPFGGYVRIAGMNPLEEIHPDDRDRVFKAKSGWQQAIVLIAGSFTHFIVALLIAAGLLAFAGIPDKPTTTIASVSETLPDSTTPGPAKLAGFQPGDRVIEVNGRPVTDWQSVREIIRASPNQEVRFGVERDGRRLLLTARLASRNPEGEQVGFLGVGSKFTTKRFGPLASFKESGKLVWRGSIDSLKALGTVASPKTFGRLIAVATGREERRVTDPTSIVGIGRAAGELAGRGAFVDLFYIIVGFNIFIGVANLLPLPPLDGGHLAVLGYETVRKRSRRWRREGKRTVDMRKLLPVSVAVVSVLVTLFVLSLYLDIVKPLPSLPG